MASLIDANSEVYLVDTNTVTQVATFTQGSYICNSDDSVSGMDNLQAGTLRDSQILYGNYFSVRTNTGSDRLIVVSQSNTDNAVIDLIVNTKDIDYESSICY